MSITTSFSYEDGRTVCEFTDDHERVFVFSVQTSEYENQDLANQAALALAIAASDTYIGG